MLLQLSLIPPSPQYTSSYDSFCDEWAKTGERQFPWLVRVISPIDVVVDDAHQPASTYWLVDEREVLGVAYIRHRLNVNHLISGGHIECAIRKSHRRLGYGTELLRLALDKAEECGIRSALLICDKNDVASQKMLDKNGGIFESAQTDEKGNILYRYWIRI